MNWLILCTVLIFTCKSRKYNKAHNVAERLNKFSECLEELCYFFIMSDVEKRKAILVACCLNKLYGCYASLQTFLNYLIKKKEQKRNKLIRKFISSTVSKSSTKKTKRNSPRLWIRPGQTSSWWDNFCAGQKVSEEWKENFCTSQESFEKLCTELRPYIQKNKTRFRDPISVEKQVATTLYYLADEDRMRKVANSFGNSTVSKLQILLVSGNRQFPKLSGLSLKLFQNILEVNILFYLQMRRILRKWH